MKKEQYAKDCRSQEIDNKNGLMASKCCYCF